jgi:hypothetical protein
MIEILKVITMLCATPTYPSYQSSCQKILIACVYENKTNASDGEKLAECFYDKPVQHCPYGGCGPDETGKLYLHGKELKK